MKLVWLALGWLCVGVGGIGIVVPGLPSTVFFIGAAACFSRGSPRFEQWVLDLPTVGPLVRDYRAGAGMPKRAKVSAVAMMWIAIIVSGIVIGSWRVQLAFVVLGAIGTWFITVRTPTKVVS